MFIKEKWRSGNRYGETRTVKNARGFIMTEEMSVEVILIQATVTANIKLVSKHQRSDV